MTDEEARRPGAGTTGLKATGEVTAILPPAYPRGGDPVRRAILRERLYLRRRATKMLDQHLVEEHPYREVDYAATGLNLGVRERELAAGVAA